MIGIKLTGPWPPGSSNIPDDGVDVEPEAALARAQGEPSVIRLATGLTQDGVIPTVEFRITEDGEVQPVTPGWEPVVEGGRVIALREVADA